MSALITGPECDAEIDGLFGLVISVGPLR